MDSFPKYSPAVLTSAMQHLVGGVTARQRVIGSGSYEVAAVGAEVQLSNGRVALDLGSYAVPLFGHRPEPVTAAVHEALDVLPTSTKLLVNPQTARLAQRLVSALDPAHLTKVWFGLNGSDVVEATLKLAIAGTGRPAALAAEGAFHGKSMGALALTADPDRRAPVQGFLGDVRHLPLEPDAVARAAARAPFAALFVEPVQGEGGGRPLPPALLRRWSDDAHAAGAFVVADEIQCGFGRCGPLSVAVSIGMEVDAVLLGKPLGGGVMPLSAAVCSPALFAHFETDPYFHTTTFGGHPASCAAGSAALDLLESSTEALDHVGQIMADGLDQLSTRHPDLIGAVRRQGALGAVECRSAEQAGMIVLDAGRRGVLLAQCLTAPSVFRLLPPAVITDDQFAMVFAVLDKACAAARTRGTTGPPMAASTGTARM